jgi:hypothetical protein
MLQEAARSATVTTAAASRRPENWVRRDPPGSRATHTQDTEITRSPRQPWVFSDPPLMPVPSNPIADQRLSPESRLAYALPKSISESECFDMRRMVDDSVVVGTTHPHLGGTETPSTVSMASCAGDSCANAMATLEAACRGRAVLFGTSVLSANRTRQDGEGKSSWSSPTAFGIRSGTTR